MRLPTLRPSMIKRDRSPIDMSLIQIGDIIEIYRMMPERVFNMNTGEITKLQNFWHALVLDKGNFLFEGNDFIYVAALCPERPEHHFRKTKIWPNNSNAEIAKIRVVAQSEAL